jgi:hypothetical protein
MRRFAGASGDKRSADRGFIGLLAIARQSALAIQDKKRESK